MGPIDTRPMDRKIAKVTIFDEIDGELVEEMVIDGVVSSLSADLSVENSYREESAPPQVTVTLEATSIRHNDNVVNEKRIYRKVGELVPELFDK